MAIIYTFGNGCSTNIVVSRLVAVGRVQLLVELFFDWKFQKSESRNGNQNVIKYCAPKYAMHRGDLELWIGRGVQ